MNPSLDVQVRRTPARLILFPSRVWIGIIAIVVLGVFLVWQSRPWILWAYNIQRAGALQSAAITYSEPRYSDSLPVERDVAANDAALAHLAAAIQWRPQDAYAYRLAADSYMAKGNWTEALSILEQAQIHAGDDPLVGWKRVLAYEQINAVAQRTPEEILTTAFTTATPDTPHVSVRTPYCTSASIASCYVGSASFQLPMAGSAYTGIVEADTIFIHPPARITAPITVPAGQPALSFVLGLDPQAYGWGTDGATFQAWVVEPDGGIIPVYERFIPAEQLQQGWTPDFINLTPWAGQTIHLTIGTDAGPQGHNTGDWVGWGNVAIRDSASALAATMDAEGHIRSALAESGIDVTELLARGDEANNDRLYDEAQVWYHRAELTGTVITSTVAYAKFLQVQETEGFTTSLPLLELAVNADAGWSHPSRRFNAFFAYGRYLTGEEKDYEGGSRILQGALDSLPSDLNAAGTGGAEAHWWMAVALRGLKDYAEALSHAETAARLNPNQFNIQALYGFLVYENDPDQLEKVEAILKRALSLEESVTNWRSIIIFWLENDQETLALNYCQQASTEFSAEALGNICWSGDAASSSIAYRDYLAAIRNGKPEDAYIKLEESIRSDAGWLNDSERFRAWESWSLYLYDNGDYEQAIPALEKAITLIVPDVRTSAQFDLYASLGRAYSSTERYSDALPIFEQALAIIPNSFLYFDYGIALYHKEPQALQTADDAFTDAVEYSSKPSETRAGIITFWYQMEERANAEAWCDTDISDSLAETLCTNGAVDTSGDQYNDYLALKSEEPEAANALLEAAITQDAGWQQLTYRFQAWRAWGDLLFNTGEYTPAIEATRTAIDAKDYKVSTAMMSEAYRLLGLSYAGNEDNDNAINAFKTALSLNESNVWAYIHYGKTLYAEDPSQLETVTELLRTAVTLAPDDVVVWQSVLGFWQQFQYTETFVTFCSLANDSMLQKLGGTCWNGEGTASQNSFAEYSQQLRNGETVLAYEALEQAVEVDGGWRNGEERFAAWQAWSRYVIQQGDSDQIIAVLEHTLTLLTDSVTPNQEVELRVALARSYRTVGDFDNAVTQAQQAVEVKETDPWVHIYLGEYTYLQSEDAIATTVAEFTRALDLAGDAVPPWQYIIGFWWRQGQATEVATLCASASAVVSSSIEIQCWNGNGAPSALVYSQYLTALQADKQPEAYTHLEAAITTDSGWGSQNDRYNAWRGWALYLWQEQSIEEAIPAFEKAVEIAPGNVLVAEMSELYRYYGLSLWSVNRREEALDALSQAVIEDDTNIWAHIHYGKYLYTFQGENSAAVQAQLSRALEIGVSNPTIWENIIRFWLEKAEYSEASILCDQAPDDFQQPLLPYCWPVDEQPSTQSYRVFQGQLATAPDTAYAALQQAVLTDSGWISPQEQFNAWRSWSLYLANAAVLDETTIAALQRAIDVAPDGTDPVLLSEPYRYLGIAYVQFKDYERALPALQKAVELAPNNMWAHIHYGKFAYAADPAANRDLAIEQFDLALTLAGTNTTIWENLIQFWITANDKPQAQLLCDRAATLLDISTIKICPVVN